MKNESVRVVKLCHCKFFNQMIERTASDEAMSSAFVIERAEVLYFLKHQLIFIFPERKTYPGQDFGSSIRFSKDEYEYACRNKSFLRGYRS